MATPHPSTEASGSTTRNNRPTGVALEIDTVCDLVRTSAQPSVRRKVPCLLWPATNTQGWVRDVVYPISGRVIYRAYDPATIGVPGSSQFRPSPKWKDGLEGSHEAMGLN